MKWFKRGEFNIAFGEIIVLVIGFILLISMMPSALASFYTVNTGNWTTAGCVVGTSACNGVNDTATNAIWRLMPLMGVIAAFGLIAIPVLKRI